MDTPIAKKILFIIFGRIAPCSISLFAYVVRLFRDIDPKFRCRRSIPNVLSKE